MVEMLKNVVIFVLLGMLVWFSSVIVRLENFHYASRIGMCSEIGFDQLIKRDQCLNATSTRTNWVWHLFYALKY